jgi:hypothetical protein
MAIDLVHGIIVCIIWPLPIASDPSLPVVGIMADGDATCQ